MKREKLNDILLGMLLGSAITMLGICIFLTAASPVNRRRDTKRYMGNCYIEIEGNENRSFPLYELHPLEDCKE